VPFARVIVLALALTHAVGLAEEVRRDVCAAECEDDGCATDCGPLEADCECHCPAGAQLVGTAVFELVSTIDPPPMFTTFEGGQRAHASPDPREILHVPKRVA